MKITQPMLKGWIDIPKNILEITNQNIIEVESFQPMVDATLITVGYVLTCEKHPNADTLFVTTVDVGNEVLQIVCGASNVAKDQTVIVARVGSVLPGNFEIKNAKIRGIDSQGMICSLNELGFEEKLIPLKYQGGIFYYDEKVEIGSDPLEALGLEGFVLELGLTPNRSDLLSVYGFAHDLGAMINKPVKQQTIHYTITNEKNPVVVETKTKGCPIYYAAYAKDLKIKPSPWWLKSALIANGIKPINNVVDISNYVLLEYGTPLHMFDALKLKTNHIVVRDAKQGEKVVTLDEAELVLSDEDVVITNNEEVVAVGGVMGCLNTMIDDNSKEVIVEAAYFDPKRIQKTSKRLNLRSDSSLRFERGVDTERVELGLKRALELLVILADAKISETISKDIKETIENPSIELTTTKVNLALGTSLTQDQIVEYLKRYGYALVIQDDMILAKAPHYRNDILLAADIYEEIARIYGLDNIEIKRHPVTQKGGLTFSQRRLRHLRHTLSSKGLHEIISYSLIAPQDIHKYNVLGDMVTVLMPLSEDKKALRQSLVHGLLQSVKYNQARQNDNINIFEIGNVFAHGVEKLYLGIALTQNLYQSSWQKHALTSDFYVLKGLLESLFKPLGIDFTYSLTSDVKSYHPYRQAHILYEGKPIGKIAEVHQKALDELDITKTVLCELDLELLLKEEKTLVYEPISRYPTITRDMAIVVGDDVLASDLLDMIKQTGRPYLIDVDVFDVYVGEHIEKGKKSLAFRMKFNDSNKTLQSEDVDKVVKKIVNRLIYSYQAIVR